MAGLVLILIGGLFLLHNFGWVDWAVFGFLWQFWPVILILLGLKLLSAGSYLGRQLVGIAGTLLVVYLFLYAVYATSPVSRDILAPLAPYFPHKEEQRQEQPAPGIPVPTRSYYRLPPARTF